MVNRQDPRDPLDHHTAHLTCRLAHERDARCRDVSYRGQTQRLGAHPFSPGPRLTRAAPAKDQPDAPRLT